MCPLSGCFQLALLCVLDALLEAPQVPKGVTIMKVARLQSRSPPPPRDRPPETIFGPGPSVARGSNVQTPVSLSRAVIVARRTSE